MKRIEVSLRRFGHYLLYLLSIHVVALFFFFVFRLTLFCSIDYQFPEEIRGDIALQAIAFIRGLWFDNVIACYLLLLPLVVIWIAAFSTIHPDGFLDRYLSISYSFIRFVSSFRWQIFHISNTSLRRSIHPFIIGLVTEERLPVWCLASLPIISLSFWEYCLLDCLVGVLHFCLPLFIEEQKVSLHGFRCLVGL